MPDTPLDTQVPTLADLKRAARKVRSRHPLAKAHKGGRGSRKPAAGKSTIDSPASKNSDQKGLPQASVPTVMPFSSEVSAPISDTSAPVAPSPTPLSDEELWSKSGDINVLVYARPVNPRLLLITLDDGTHGRCLMHPVDRQRFSVGKRIWVRHERKDVYRLVGRYNRWGGRCA